MLNKPRDYSPLLAKLSEEYAQHAPASARWQEKGARVLVDGGSHTKRLIQPFPPRITSAQGAYVVDEDANRILDFWQGHYANILGHDPKVTTDTLAEAFSEGFGSQTGFPDRLQVEVAEIICQQTGAERVRFTTSGTLSTMYAILLTRAFTKREKVIKVGGGWHGGHLWGLKGVGYHVGFEDVDSIGLPLGVIEDVVVTTFNDSQKLEDHFRQYGDELACFILEPVIGAGGLMPAKKEYIQLARQLCDQYGVLLIFDEVISGFRFRAGDVGVLYGVKPDLITLGKIIGGGMPVAAVGGRGEIMDLVGRAGGRKVKFSGGTFSGHPASMLAARTMLSYLMENESEIYPRIARTSTELRTAVVKSFAGEGIQVRFSGDKIDGVLVNSLHMLLFPYHEDLDLTTPDEIKNPQVCDVALTEKVIQLAMLLEDVHVVHGLGSISSAHTSKDIQVLCEAYGRVAKRVKSYL